MEKDITLHRRTKNFVGDMQKLTGKEEEVLELMWQLGECAPKDIVAQYPEPQPHVNTIATMVQSLERKGYVSHRAQGRGYIYFPVVNRDDYGRSKLGGFVDRYFKHSYMELVSSLVAEEKVSEQELVDFLNELKKQ
jgi:predicted transcriptional regulator